MRLGNFWIGKLPDAEPTDFEKVGGEITTPPTRLEVLEGLITKFPAKSHGTLAHWINYDFTDSGFQALRQAGNWAELARLMNLPLSELVMGAPVTAEDVEFTQQPRFVTFEEAR